MRIHIEWKLTRPAATARVIINGTIQPIPSELLARRMEIQDHDVVELVPGITASVNGKTLQDLLSCIESGMRMELRSAHRAVVEAFVAAGEVAVGQDRVIQVGEQKKLLTLFERGSLRVIDIIGRRKSISGVIVRQSNGVWILPRH